MASRVDIFPEKSLAQIIAEIRDEFKEYVSTRVALLREEMREKSRVLSSAIPAIAAGAVFALFAAVLLTFALVGILAMVMGGGAGAWAGGFAIVGVLYGLIAAGAIMYGVDQLKTRNLKPERTLRVLKQDQVWLQEETRKRA